MAGSIKFIYEDDDILVCHKGAGIATEGAGAGKMDVISAARNYLARKTKRESKGRQRNLPPYVATINRLDQPVEGVLILAKNRKAASNLSKQIKDRSAEKYYYALCQGIFDEKRGRLEDNIVRTEDGRSSVVISDEEKKTFKNDSVMLSNGNIIRVSKEGVKKGILDFEVVREIDGISLLRIHLKTGRFHQIRVQLSSRGYPILGDLRYCSEDSLVRTNRDGIKSICLIAYKMVIKHPKDGEIKEYEINPENEFVRKYLNVREVI